jgi:polysaccharide export outer membrane protein
MKSAIRSAAFAASTLTFCAVGFPQSKPADPVAAQAQSKPAEPAPVSNSAASPAAAAPAMETDPAKIAQPAAKPAVVNSDPSYVIGAEDVLVISVWGDPRLSGSYLVRPDGRISMALVGEVTAAGLTPGELETAIGDQLKQKEILKRPQVTVQVNQINSKKYFIQGEVLKPGPNPLVVPTTILEALVNAGGFKDFANTKKIEVIRGNERFKFNYKDVIHGKHTEQNIRLKPGDIIIVP